MRLLVAVAHPDDESFGCGSVLAHAVAHGYETAVVCATRGEAGDSLVSTDDLAAVREAELRAAAGILGVSHVRVLGYADSGMAGPPGAGALVDADLTGLTSTLTDVIEDLQPDVVVTLDGSDGHRDHVVLRDAMLAAVDGSGCGVEATYLWCLARSSMRRWAEHLRAAGRGEAYLALGELGTPDEEITAVVDATPYLDLRWSAMRAHASQVNPYEDLPADLQRDFLGHDRLRLVRGPGEWPAARGGAGSTT